LVSLDLDEPNWSYEFFKFWLHLNQNIKKVFWKSTLHRRPWVLSKLNPTVIPLRHYSLESLTMHKTHWPLLLLPEVPPLMKTITGEGNRAAWLTGGERGPARGGVGSGRFLRSQRGTTRRRWWSESAGPRAQAGELVGGECSGLTTVIPVNPMAQGAPRGDVETMRAVNWKRAQRLTRSTCAGGAPNRDKSYAKSCQTTQGWVQTFPGGSRGIVAPLCQLGQVVFSLGLR
jgi:hypothetical protein